MSRADKAAAWAEEIAANPSHGYDQANRWGPDYDCSSFVITAFEQAGVPVQTNGASFTGNMKGVFLRCGFEDVTGSIVLDTGAGLLRGDVLLNTVHHTAICCGGGMIVHARHNEHGEITGGLSGDQTGQEIVKAGYFNFPWDCVLRLKETQEKQPEPVGEDNVYVVEPGDTLWDLAERLLGNGTKYGDIMKENCLQSILIHPGQALRIPAGQEKRTISITVKATTAASLERLARASGSTVGECIDNMF